ncbi:MAG: CSLREA domain-containing protein [Chloroflexi bacterium]|nr:CSLREA domain-containing protein [Chloroflexota bacterium]
MKIKLLTTLLFSLSLMLVLFHIRATPAYAGGVITVTITTDNDNDDDECSLREAIIAANGDVAYHGCPAGSGDDIINMTTLSGTITLESHLPIITRTLQFNGPATESLIIDGLLNTYNAITSTGGGVNIGLDHLTVTNVISDGIYATNNITVTNSTIVAAGCGVYSKDGGAFVSNSHIAGNGCDGVAVYTTATITAGSTISGAVDGVYSDDSDVFVYNSVITGTTGTGVNAWNTAAIANSTRPHFYRNSNGTCVRTSFRGFPGRLALRGGICNAAPRSPADAGRTGLRQSRWPAVC